VRKLLPLFGLLVALAAPASAPAVEIGLNVAGGAAAGPSDVDAVADTGARTARHFLFFDDIDTGGMRNFRANVIEKEKAKGIKTLIVVAGKTQAAPNSDEYARKMGEMASIFKDANAMAYEVWNEADEALWWKPAPSATAYVDLLRKSYAAIKAADPSATVLATPLTGANYAFMEELYKAGAKGHFDAAAVHTDTACLIDSPYSYYRDNGRIARFTFLGVREVKATMAANGDGGKPIWLTEIGWAARANETCDSGAFAGKKAAGVTLEQQAQFMLEAFHCLQTDPAFGVDHVLWFTHKDNHYGLMDANGAHRPAYNAFKGMAGNTSNDKLTGPCGDFVPPPVQILEPAPGAIIGDRDSLKIRATSSDKEVLRMTFAVASQLQEIRNFTNNGNPLNLATPPFLDWQGVRNLAFGKHRVIVTALDRSGNEGRAEVEFTRVNPATLKPMSVKFNGCPKKKKRGTVCKSGLLLSGKGKKRKLQTKVGSALSFVITGKLKAEWQNKRKGKWKKIHGGSKNAQNKGKNGTVTFNQKLKYGGQWRVRVVYSGKAPFKKTVSKWLTFRA
jgi:hypothetical protein